MPKDFKIPKLGSPWFLQESVLTSIANMILWVFVKSWPEERTLLVKSKNKTKLSLYIYIYKRKSFYIAKDLVAQTVKNPLAMWETCVWCLGWEDPLEEGMATHSSILTWKILMNRGAWWATVHGVAKSWTLLCSHIAKDSNVLLHCTVVSNNVQRTGV